jgi:hypothetical protein
MNSSKGSPTKLNHAVITIEPLNKDLENVKISSSLPASQRQYPSDALAELQRQQRKRLAIQICSWFLWIMIILLVSSGGYAIYCAFYRN